VVEINETRVYSAAQTLVIAPGTTLRFAENASLITYGKLFAEGRPNAKIQFMPSGTHWGGLALQGPKTQGSRLSYVEFIQGTRPSLRFFGFPGMVNVHDTKDVGISHALFTGNKVSDDALHVAYVEGLALTDSLFKATNSDAADLEYSSAKIERLTVLETGDDCLDLMGTRVEILGSKLIRCKGNAVSVGEHSNVLFQDGLAAESTRGLLLKNASTLRVRNALLHRNGTSVRVEPETEWYPGASQLDTVDVHAAFARKQLDGLTSPNSGTIDNSLQADDLPALRHLLLGDDGEWGELDTEISAMLREGRP
jgi:hypothetical protein